MKKLILSLLLVSGIVSAENLTPHQFYEINLMHEMDIFRSGSTCKDGYTENLYQDDFENFVKQAVTVFLTEREKHTSDLNVVLLDQYAARYPLYIEFHCSSSFEEYPHFEEENTMRMQVWAELSFDMANRLLHKVENVNP